MQTSSADQATSSTEQATSSGQQATTSSGGRRQTAGRTAGVSVRLVPVYVRWRAARRGQHTRVGVCHFYYSWARSLSFRHAGRQRNIIRRQTGSNSNSCFEFIRHSIHHPVHNFAFCNYLACILPVSCGLRNARQCSVSKIIAFFVLSWSIPIYFLSTVQKNS